MFSVERVLGRSSVSLMGNGKFSVLCSDERDWKSRPGEDSQNRLVHMPPAEID